MKKNGFTLIELLAVIVILAIIALIATPIILGIINDAREESNDRSVELYASAVRNGIAAYQLRTGNQIEAKTYTKDTLPFKPEYDGKVDCTNIIISEDGKVSLDKCTVNGGTKEYSYGMEEETPAAKVCTIERQDESKYSVGDVVTCNIGETTDKFYVIEEQPLTATTIQMLTEKNIHTTSYRQSDDAGTVAFAEITYWLDENGRMLPKYQSLYLQEYGIDIYDIYDENNNIIRQIVDGYIQYLTQKLTSATASLLTYSQAKDLGCSYNGCTCANAPSWVSFTNYWTSTSTGSTSMFVIIDGYFDFVGYESSINNLLGVRPVITISTSDIK